jgi:beta-N-acetylhexosaminidase
MTGELESLAARCIFPGFLGLAPPDWVRSWAQRGLGGVVLFARNVEGREQLASLTAAVHAEREGVLVAVDEEGGDVTRLEAAEGSSYPGNWALGVVDDVALTERVAASMGAELAAVGVDLDLAPVADVNSNPDNPVIGIRSFGADAALVARHVAAWVRGLQGAGVAACAKHFPGHGDTQLDSHLALPAVEADRATLLARELVPFRAAADAGVRAVMTAHVVVRALDNDPATLSRPVLHGLLREELGFEGAVITDALEMRAVLDTVGLEESAVRALAAGADALCLGADLGADEESVAAVHAAIVEAVRSGRLEEARVAEAAARVDGVPMAGAARRSAEPGVGEEAAGRALLVEGDAALDGPAFVVELRPPASIAAGRASYGLGDALRRRSPATEVLELDGRPAEAVRAPAGRRLVVVVRDAHRHEWQRETAEALLAPSGGVVAELGIPRWRPANASGYIATHGAGRVNLDAAAATLAR